MPGCKPRNDENTAKKIAGRLAAVERENIALKAKIKELKKAMRDAAQSTMIDDVCESRQGVQSARARVEQQFSADFAASDHKRMEDALRSSEETAVAILNASKEVIFLMDRSGIVLAANKATAHTLGVEPRHLIGRCVYDFFPPDLAEMRRAVCQEVIQTGRPITYGVEGMRGAYFQSTVYPVSNKAGEVTRLVVFTVDITERKRAEQQLRESEERFRTLNEAVFEGLGVSEQGGIADANEQLARILGYDRAELIGTPLKRYVHEEDREWVLENVHLGQDATVEHRMIRKDGTVITVEAHGKTITQEGRQRRFTAIRDITERKRMVEALRRSHDELEQRVHERTRDLAQANIMLLEEIELRKKAEHEFRTLADDAPDIIMRFDRECRHRYINPTYERVYGQSPDAFLGKTCLEIGLPQALASSLHNALTRVISKGEVLDFEFERPSPAGIKQIATHVAPIFGPDGSVSSALVISRDVTAKHHLEKAARERQKMEAIGTLAGGIAHDFNNMLAVILGNAELALDDENLEDIRANLTQILNASRRSRDLVKQILTFSRRSEGRREIVKLSPLINETAAFLRGSLPSTIAIKVGIQAESDSILGNLSQVQQILMNLATNAAHAMGEEGGTLAIRLSDITFKEGDPLPDGDMKAGRYLKLTVRDTGTGIPSDIRARIFDPFFTTKEPGQGTGMGLAVVFGIVKSHGGAITVTSKIGKGTVFTVFLPSVSGTAAEESVDMALPPRGKERVLIVDDEPSVLEVVSQRLKRLGYKVATARSGSEGWKKFEEDPHRFDLVITDQIMPEMTGIRLSEKMLGVRPDLPIILSTGYSETVSAEEAAAAGISEFLMKPIETRALAEAVRRVLDSRKEVPSGL